MRIIQAIVFIANILLLLGVNIYLWTISWCWGLGGIMGIVGFFIGYAISGDMKIAPRDYWRFPKYEIFKKKMAYASSVAGSVTVIASFIIMMFAALIQ